MRAARERESREKLRLLMTDLRVCAFLSLSDIARRAPSAIVITTENIATDTSTSISVNPRILCAGIFISASGGGGVWSAHRYLSRGRHFDTPRVAIVGRCQLYVRIAIHRRDSQRTGPRRTGEAVQRAGADNGGAKVLDRKVAPYFIARQVFSHVPCAV